MLDEIVASVRRRLPATIERAHEFESSAAAMPEPVDVAAALGEPGLSVIAEVKRRSPSVGPIALDLDPAAIAGAYERGGASAVSVLTESDHFGGSLADLRAVRQAVDISVLRKDFLIHPAQIWQARANGADLILLIVAILDDADLSLLLETATEAGLAALVEAHTDAEAKRAVAAGARIVGVNNRDLTTFTVDLATAERIRSTLGDEVIAVAESGVSSPDGARRMFEAGYDAVLVGEAAVRSGDPEAFVRSLKQVGR